MNLVTAPAVVPPAPSGLELSLYAFDLSPLRPDEFMQQRMLPWMRAIKDRAAYNKGMEIARKEAAGKVRITELIAARQRPPDA